MNCGSRHPSAALGTFEMVFSFFLPHPFSPLGTCTLSGLGFGSEIWELLSKAINIFYLLFSLTASYSVGAIPVHVASQKWLGKTWASSYQTQPQVPRWKCVTNLCYPLSFPKFLWSLSRAPGLWGSRALKASSAAFGELFPPPLLPELRCIDWKAKSPGLHFDRNAFP